MIKNKEILKYYGLAVLPIFFGILTYVCIPLRYLWLVTGIIVFPMMIFLLGPKFVEAHKILWRSYSVSTVYFFIGLYFFVGVPLFLMGNMYHIATALILCPIIEEFVSRAFFCIVQLKINRQFFFLVILSAASFALMHWINDPSVYNFTLVQHIQKFLGHFIFAILLALNTFFLRRIDFIIILHAVSNLGHVLNFFN